MNAPVEIARAVCPHDCPDTCAMRVTYENGRATKVAGDPDHPPTQGVLCTKVSRYPERIYHPNRLLTPMKRVGKKGEGRFEPITWDEAFTLAAERLSTVAARAPEAIVPYSFAGTMGLIQGDSLSQRFFHAIGASRLERAICSAAGVAGLKYTLGASVGMQNEFFSESEVILIWGANPIASSLHFWTRAQEAKRRGAKLIAIDPYRSLTAEKCHQHIAIRPGTDAALALGMMHVLIAEDLLDREYIDAYTLGFDALRERALIYTPARVAEICGVAEHVVTDLARLFGSTKKAAIRLNYGLQRVRGGGNAVRAIASLPGLTGAWRERAGGALLSSSSWAPADMHALQRPDLMPGWPSNPSRMINMNAIGDALLHPGDSTFGPKIEAVVVYNSNPVAVAPESEKVAAGFAREDLFTIVLEHFQTDTADYADLLLPATMQFEHLDVHKSYGHTHIMANLPSMQPRGDARTNTDIFRGIAQRMGLTEPALFETDEQIAASSMRWNDATLRGADWQTLKQHGWIALDVPDAPFANGGFPTPSGKCEFFSERLAKEGGDPLPDYLPPYESAEGSPALAARYPLAMISPPARNFLNSTFVNIDSLRSSESEPHLDIHPEDAAARHILEGAMVRIFNDRGSMQARARLTEKTRRGLVVGLSIWWKKLAPDGRNANQLTSQRLTDLGNSATFYDCLVEVEAA